MTCSIEGCEKPVRARGWCVTHWARWRRNGDPLVAKLDRQGTPMERFWRKVDKSGDCWVWRGPLNAYGYGNFHIEGKTHQSHRLSYESLRGPIPDGFEIDHLCRNRRCINPDHLEPVTPYVNNMRSFSFAAVNARKTHCPKGHPLDGDNLYRHPNGGRMCRTCRRDQRQKWNAAQRQKENMWSLP